MTDLLDTPVPAGQDSGPSWCVGCDEGEAFHATEFDGPDGIEPDTDAIARLVQEGDVEPVIELGANDADGDSAVVRLSLAQAGSLADLLNDLITSAHLG